MAKRLKIYTTTGDKGETSLYSGDRVEKSHVLIKALGAIDKCNSAIGLVVTYMQEDESLTDLSEQLIYIQSKLFDLGAAVATPRKWASEKKQDNTNFSIDYTRQLEKWIDSMDGEIEPLTQFILPGGHIIASQVHIARSITREAESFITSIFKDHQVEYPTMCFLNRLSDYLFTLARVVNKRKNVPEPKWKKD
tara:strand:- start:517 stop:1095 length:579 start_codon:yes stop_codon:yes gene_type:complete